MDNTTRQLIKDEFVSCIARTIDRLKDEPVYFPFHEKLISKETMFWGRFERSFTRSFSQSSIDHISLLVAKAHGAEDCTRRKTLYITVPESVRRAVDTQIHLLRDGTRSPNWHNDLTQILSASASGSPRKIRLISDLFFVRNRTPCYFFVKHLRPSVDQSADIKKDMLLLKASDTSSAVYCGFYYNPFGETRQQYVHAAASTFFDMNNDSCILLGRDYWETLGVPGTYEEVLAIAEEAGESMRSRIEQYRLSNQHS